MIPSLGRDLVLLLILATIWSSSFTVIKIGVEVIPPVTLAMMRITIAAAVLYGWLKAKGHSLPTEPRVWWSFFLIGCVGNAFPFTMINWGEQAIPSGLAAIMIASMPLAALVLGRIFSDEVFNVRRLTGVLVGFAGVVYLIGPQELLSLGEQAVRQLAVALAAMLYAVSGILLRKLPKASPLEHGAGVMIMSSVVLIPASLFGDQPWTIDFTADALAAGVYLGVLPTALATIILIMVIASRGVTFVSLNNYLIPILGVMWGVLFLDETVSSEAIVALVLIFSGITIAGTGPTIRKI